MKKKLFLLLGTLATVALLIIGGFRYYSHQKEAQYATTAVPYIKHVIPELSKWDPEVARNYMSADFMSKTSADNFARVINALSRLGTLEQMGAPHFEEIYSDDKQTVISYTLDAHYSSGDAVITISLLDQDGKLAVYRFNVQSKALLAK